MPLDNRYNEHNFLGIFPNIAGLPTDPNVEVGDIAYSQADGMQECFATGPVQWRRIGGGSINTPVSLDDAYNFTGSGAGRTIDVNAGSVDLLSTQANVLNVKNGGASIVQLNRSVSDGEIVVRNSAGDRINTISPDQLNFSVGAGNNVIIDSDGLITIDSTGNLTLESSAEVLLTSSRQTINLDQNSVNFGGDLLNQTNEVFHAGGSVGSVVGETSNSITHALNSLGNALGQILGSDSPKEKFATNNIPPGIDEFDVVFTTPFASTNYTVNISIQNDTASFQHIVISLKNKQADRFTVVMSDVTPSSNYKINWHAKLP